MIVAALVSSVLVGAFNYLQSRSLLRSAVTDQVVDVASSRVDLIERGLENLRDRTAVLAVEPTVVEAIVDLSAGYAATDERLAPGQQPTLEEAYAVGVEVATPPGVEPPPAAELVPRSPTARYLQYHYLATVPAEERADVDDPGDGSAYSAAHAEHHDALRSVTDLVTSGDVVLVDLEGVVVYSTLKRIDFGTDLATGPHAGSGLAEALRRLETASTDEVVVVDYTQYAPARGLPEMWVAAIVRDEDEIVGAVAGAVGNEALVEIMTAGADWDQLGLGRTGEAYVVGTDTLLRSESRLWLEDPDAYLDAMVDAGYDEDVVQAVETFDTTVLTQPADIVPVEEAQRGVDFVGPTDDYLGRGVVSVARQVDPGGLGWVVVVGAERSEVFEPLDDFVLRLVLITLLGVPLVVLAAVTIARRMLRPLEPITAGVERVTDGDVDVELAMPGRDEFADLAAQFDLFLAELRQQREQARRTDAEITELLASVMPRRLVEEYRAGRRDIAESMRNATLVAVVLHTDAAADVLSEDEVARYSTRIAAGVATLAREHGAEQIATSAATSMFAVGLDSDELEVEQAVAFALAARRWVDALLAEEGVGIGVGFGVAAGDVVANVMGTQRVAFDVLGAPRHAAEMLARATGDEVLVGAAVASRLDGVGELERVEGLQDIGGTPIDGWRLVVTAERP